MRTAILSAILAVIPAFCQGSDDAKSKPAAEQATQQQDTAKPKDATPEMQSPKVTIPVAPAQAPENSGSPAAPPPAPGMAPETDPAKMAAPASGTLPKGTQSVSDTTYIIGSEDIVRIQVWGNPALSADYIVRPDGKISLVLVGEVQASGKTPQQVEQDLAARLKAGDFIKDPQVSVGIQQINSKKYYIQGEVNKPGVYPLIGPTTILEALVNAGGFRDFANQKNINIITEGGKKILKFNYKDVIRGKHLEENIQLKPGDQIVVK